MMLDLFHIVGLVTLMYTGGSIFSAQVAPFVEGTLALGRTVRFGLHPRRGSPTALSAPRSLLVNTSEVVVTRKDGETRLGKVGTWEGCMQEPYQLELGQ
jgi:hypothetical protein